MKDGIYEKIKRSKPFMKKDLLVYLFIIFFLCILFFLLSITKTDQKSLGFSIVKDNNEVAVFNTLERSLSVSDEYENLTVITESETGITLTIYKDQSLNDYNVVYFDFSSNTARVTDSTCSTSKDCAHTTPIKNSGIIACVPHRLKIIPIGRLENDQPITG